MRMERRHEPEKLGRPRLKRALTIGLVVLGVLILVAALVVTGAIPLGTVILRLDQETYRPDETITLTIRSLRTGTVQFGTPFAIQRSEDGEWVDVPFGVGWADMPEGRSAVWTGNLIVIGPGLPVQQRFVPAEHFFETPEQGRYRVLKEVEVGMIHAGADREAKTLYAEFSIEG